nr:MAG TPA: hypothetical protein [Caudoviricetes sp.]
MPLRAARSPVKGLPALTRYLYRLDLIRPLESRLARHSTL